MNPAQNPKDRIKRYEKVIRLKSNCAKSRQASHREPPISCTLPGTSPASFTLNHGKSKVLKLCKYVLLIVVTSLLSNLDWKDMEKQKQQLQTWKIWKHAAFLQETSTKSDTDGATWTTKPQAIARQWEALAVWFGCLEAIHRSIQPQIHCGVGRFCSLRQEWTHRKLMKVDESWWKLMNCDFQVFYVVQALCAPPNNRRVTVAQAPARELSVGILQLVPLPATQCDVPTIYIYIVIIHQEFSMQLTHTTSSCLFSAGSTTISNPK